jgi:predicted small lipoprotein YifL
MKEFTVNVAQITINVALAAVLAASAGACGKKTAPIPPEDVPPAKKERSSSKLGVQYTFS